MYVNYGARVGVREVVGGGKRSRMLAEVHVHGLLESCPFERDEYQHRLLNEGDERRTLVHFVSTIYYSCV